MTYKVSSGTLNLCSLTHSRSLFRILYVLLVAVVCANRDEMTVKLLQLNLQCALYVLYVSWYVCMYVC